MIAGLLGTGLLVVVLGTACDPGANVTWVNETEEVVVVYLNDDFRPERGRIIPPRSSKTLGTITAVWTDLVVVRDEAGNVLRREEITWDELEAQDFTFVIRPEDIDDAPE